MNYEEALMNTRKPLWKTKQVEGTAQGGGGVVTAAAAGGER